MSRAERRAGPADPGQAKRALGAAHALLRHICVYVMQYTFCLHYLSVVVYKSLSRIHSYTVSFQNFTCLTLLV